MEGMGVAFPIFLHISYIFLHIFYCISAYFHVPLFHRPEGEGDLKISDLPGGKRYRNIPESQNLSRGKLEISPSPINRGEGGEFGGGGAPQRHETCR